MNGKRIEARLLLLSRCTVSAIVLPPFNLPALYIDGVSYACESFHPEAIRSALLGAIYQVLLLAFDGKEFRSHSLIHLKHSHILLCMSQVCMCVYIYTNMFFSSSSRVLSKAPQTKQQDTAVLCNVLLKPPQCQAHNSLKHCFLS